MNKHILMKLPLYLLGIYATYGTFKKYRAQPEWNATKKWNLVGSILFTFGLFLYVYEDFFMD
jgi:hypothetical protein